MGAKCNFIDYLTKTGADSRSLTQFFTVTGEVLAPGGGRSNEQFWKLSEEWMFHHGIEGVRQGTGHVSAPDLHRFISTAALKAADLADETWKQGYHNKVLRAAFEKQKTKIEQADYEMLSDYWLNKYPNMDAKPRSSVLSGVENILNTWNIGLVREIISGETTTTPDDLFAGKYWLFDFPVHTYGATGKYLMSSGKFLVQKTILKRRVKPGDAPVIIYADECQNVTNSFDAQFLAESRSHLGCMIYLTQSLHSFLTTME